MTKAELVAKMAEGAGITKVQAECRAFFGSVGGHMNLENIIRKYFPEALKSALYSYDSSGDKIMEEIMQGKIDFDPSHVKKWMLEYKLFQGTKDSDRKSIVNEIKNNIAEINAEPILDARESIIRQKFNQLFTALYKTVPRSWLSATSKLLWCAFPDDIVIYDSFVLRAITVLQWCDEELSSWDKGISSFRLPRIGNIPSFMSDKDISPLTEYYNGKPFSNRFVTRYAPINTEQFFKGIVITI
jgi:hypothetical protein